MKEYFKACLTTWAIYFIVAIGVWGAAALVVVAEMYFVRFGSYISGWAGFAVWSVLTIALLTLVATIIGASGK